MKNFVKHKFLIQIENIKDRMELDYFMGKEIKMVERTNLLEMKLMLLTKLFLVTEPKKDDPAQFSFFFAFVSSTNLTKNNNCYTLKKNRNGTDILNHELIAILDYLVE